MKVESFYFSAMIVGMREDWEKSSLVLQVNCFVLLPNNMHFKLKLKHIWVWRQQRTVIRRQVLINGSVCRKQWMDRAVYDWIVLGLSSYEGIFCVCCWFLPFCSRINYSLCFNYFLTFTWWICLRKSDRNWWGWEK